jgi:hypothetical protein
MCPQTSKLSTDPNYASYHQVLLGFVRTLGVLIIAVNGERKADAPSCGKL